NLYNLPFTVLCEVHKNWYKTPNAAPRVFDTGGHQTGAAIILGFGRSTDYDGFPYCDIGGQTTAGLRHLFGHVRNFRIWHKALTDAQVGESI
ncbi:phage tail protein, partial [Escherichia coli]|nr:phage tail protein [Escherichia coli]